MSKKDFECALCGSMLSKRNRSQHIRTAKCKRLRRQYIEESEHFEFLRSFYPNHEAVDRMLIDQIESEMMKLVKLDIDKQAVINRMKTMRKQPYSCEQK